MSLASKYSRSSHRPGTPTPALLHRLPADGIGPLGSFGIEELMIDNPMRRTLKAVRAFHHVSDLVDEVVKNVKGRQVKVEGEDNDF